MVTYTCSKNDDVRVMITDVNTGATVKEIQCDTDYSDVTIDISDLKSGIYVVNVIISGNIVEFKTISKK